MKFCFNCGTKLLEKNQKFCIKCGTKLKEDVSDLDSGNTDGKPQITNYYDYFDNDVDDDLIKSERKGNVNILLNAVDMESNTFLKVDEGFDDNDMDRVFTHLKAKAHAHDEYQKRLIYEKILKNKKHESYDSDDEWLHKLYYDESEEDREPIWGMDFKNVSMHPSNTLEIFSAGNLVFKSAVGSVEHDQWLKRKREREEWNQTLREYEEKRRREREREGR